MLAVYKYCGIGGCNAGYLHWVKRVSIGGSIECALFKSGWLLHNLHNQLTQVVSLDWQYSGYSPVFHLGHSAGHL